MPFHWESLWGATLMPHTECAMDWDKTKEWGWVKSPVRFKPFVDQSPRGYCDNVGDPSYFPTPLPDCLCHVSFSRYSPLSLEVVEDQKKCKSFLAPNFCSGETTPTFLWHVVSATYRPPFDKVWLSSVCWSPSAKPGVECGIYRGWVKTTVQFEAFCGPKFMSFLDNVADPW